MTQGKARIHPAAVMHAEEVARGELSRREFLTRATALGVTATAAYGLLGLNAPVEAVWDVLRDFNGHDRCHP